MVLVWRVVGVEVGGCVVGYRDCALREGVVLFVGVWERFGLHLIGVMWPWENAAVDEDRLAVEWTHA